MLTPDVGKKTIAMVLAGGRGEKLGPLTARRAESSVTFGGKYKLIDFVLSNLFNSGIKRVYILTQYRAYSLTKHIRESWGKWTGLGEFIVAISPETSTEGERWFRGTADAILQYLRFVESSNAEYVAIFNGDHIYRMDLRQMIQYHETHRADLTISTVEVPVREATRFGVVMVDDTSKVTGFVEKPEDPRPSSSRNNCTVSMGNYIFSTKKLIEVLQRAKRLHENLDFGRHVIPMMLQQEERVVAYDFTRNEIRGQQPKERGYWKDVGTIEAYYEANMDLIQEHPHLDLYNYDWPILTNQGNLPPAKTVFDEDGRRGQNIDSYVCGGCITSGGTVRRSIISPLCRVSSHSVVEDSILFENVSVGRGARIRKAIVDRGVAIPDDSRIGFDREEDLLRGYTVTESGITVVPRKD